MEKQKGKYVGDKESDKEIQKKTERKTERETERGGVSGGHTGSFEAVKYRGYSRMQNSFHHTVGNASQVTFQHGEISLKEREVHLVVLAAGNTLW